ncbi:MarR family winged helix-turn-helix transcriptional regulator [Flindersiella endophytica]
MGTNDGDATAAASELRLQLSRVTRRLRQQTDRSDLTMSQLSVLSRLYQAERATPSELAASEGIRPQTMSKTLDLLELAGYIGRTPDPRDRRRVLIELTDQARTAIAEDRQRKANWLASAMSTVLTADERDLLIRATPLLAKLADAELSAAPAAETAVGPAAARETGSSPATGASRRTMAETGSPDAATGHVSSPPETGSPAGATTGTAAGITTGRARETGSSGSPAGAPGGTAAPGSAETGSPDVAAGHVSSMPETGSSAGATTGAAAGITAGRARETGSPGASTGAPAAAGSAETGFSAGKRPAGR